MITAYIKRYCGERVGTKRR